MQFTVDNPKNLITEWIPFKNSNKTAEQVIKIVEICSRFLGLDLDDEQMSFVTSGSDRLLCEACAGSGKTTMSQLRLIVAKMLKLCDADDMLAIAYNTHAVDDMLSRHRDMCEVVNSHLNMDLRVDYSLTCKTFHKNAMAWLETFKSDIGVSDTIKLHLIEEDTKIYGMRLAHKVAYKTMGKVADVGDNTISALLEFESFAKETLLTTDLFNKSDKFKAIRIQDPRVVEDILKRYATFKDVKTLFDFTDLLVMFRDLLRDREEIRKQVQSAYKFLVFDEYQDMSFLMQDIIKYMVADDTYLTAIGDGDQSIYGFRGTNSLACLNFRSDFANSKVFSMGVNRRCRKEIVDYAKRVIETNEYRYSKSLKYHKEGGHIFHKEYTSKEMEYLDIVGMLKNQDKSLLYNSCIAYRNRESAYLLTRMLLEENIPFKVLSGNNPFSDILYKSIFEIIDLLRNGSSKEYQKKVLPKVLPSNLFTRVAITEMVKNVPEGTHYLELPLLDLVKNPNTRAIVEKDLGTLHRAEQMMKSGATMKQYIGLVYTQFEKYYWNWMRKQTGFCREYEAVVKADLMQDIVYSKYREKIQVYLDRLKRYAVKGTGIRLATFHGLKGLEFDDVYVVDLEDSVFPGISKQENMTEEEIKLETEESTRLFYVTVTRARNNLTLYWSKGNPSRYRDMVSQDKIENREIPEQIAWLNNVKVAEEVKQVQEEVKQEQEEVNLEEFNFEETEEFSDFNFEATVNTQVVGLPEEVAPETSLDDFTFEAPTRKINLKELMEQPIIQVKNEPVVTQERVQAASMRNLLNGIKSLHKGGV